jgi:hypothetical protein
VDDVRLLGRRDLLRLLGGAGLVAALPLLAGARPARAGLSWCRADPVVRLRPPSGPGNTAAIYLAAALEDFELNDSSGDIVVEHPKDARTDKLWEDPNGYFGQGVSTNFAIGRGLRFHDGRMDVRVRCFIPAARDDMRIRLEWAPGPIRFVDGDPLPATPTACAEGYANRWIVLETTLPYA